MLALVLVAGLAAAGTAPADPGDVVWRSLDQRAAGGQDSYADLAVSPAGTACVAGATAVAAGAAPDVLVRAFAAGGSLLWRRVWTWPGRTRDAAAAVVRDRRGSFVVAGSSGSCWLLLKYTAGGYLQWVRRGRGSFTRAAFAAVAVDSAGNVYAAGSASTAGADDRLLLRKYTPGGVLRWQRTLGSAAGDASAAAVTLGDGDVYLAGTTAEAQGGSVAVTLRYSAAGARRWLRTYVPAADAARATGIAYAGGPVVCGYAAPAEGPDHGFVVRYDAAGEQQWTAGPSAPGATGERFLALATDAAGRVCVAGTTYASSGGSEALAACFAAGAPLWALSGDGDEATAVCRSGDGFVVAGGTEAFAVSGLTPAGTLAWRTGIAPAGHSDFRATAVRAAGDGYLYAAGSAAADGGGRAAVLVRYVP